MSENSPLDGNALAGPLSEIFAVDLTAATLTCGSCSKRQPLATLVVYAGGPGSTARCRGCGDVMLRVARIRSEMVLDLRGTALLRVET